MGIRIAAMTAKRKPDLKPSTTTINVRVRPDVVRALDREVERLAAGGLRVKRSVVLRSVLERWAGEARP
jgi:hypothetical protein